MAIFLSLRRYGFVEGLKRAGLDDLEMPFEAYIMVTVRGVTNLFSWVPTIIFTEEEDVICRDYSGAEYAFAGTKRCWRVMQGYGIIMKSGRKTIAISFLLP